jgi:hypothetical protein
VVDDATTLAAGTLAVGATTGFVVGAVADGVDGEVEGAGAAGFVDGEPGSAPDAADATTAGAPSLVAVAGGAETGAVAVAAALSRAIAVPST